MDLIMEIHGILSTDTLRSMSKGESIYQRKDELYKDLMDRYIMAVRSVETYGGFYIGRYETGNLSSTKPVVRRLNNDIRNSTWYEMYTRMQNITNNGNVETMMIFSSFMDEFMNWLICNHSYFEIINLSNLWGNYENAIFTYTGSDGLSKSTKGYRYIVVPTGSTERHNMNNVYDLAGNTLEMSTSLYGKTVRYYYGGFPTTSFEIVRGYLGSLFGGCSSDSRKEIVGSRSILVIR